METVTHVRDVRQVRTSSGKTRYVVVDDEGHEYTTFRPQIGERAAEFQGKRARIEYHEEQRGQFLNVYLDGIATAEEQAPSGDDRVDEADEVAWKAAIEAAPWLMGSEEPERSVRPDEFFDRLKPFKELVSDDLHGEINEREKTEETRKASKGG